ncbi:class I SAM-dependent methyltransferase [Pelagicoccus albus]|uniref:SAM-dependent methyltransferase n=1 Tax=Pelagicoccus albus TaxID=415222 RepID=A0A7X1B4Z7_9BACT|nr:SAM-dependent methyltransferase [Pelagicoccus albus]MBC2605726.1 SAM-dependent methyltransferase [Pelagicoccus albus]
MLTKEIKKFIADHAKHSPEQLALLAGKYPDLPMPFIAQQVKGRARMRSKLPSWHENPDIVFPQSLSLEQCTSELVARYRSTLLEGNTAFDLTGGFGVDGRFLAERFERYFYNERDEELAKVAESNFAVFGLAEKVACSVGDGLEALRAHTGELDLIYVDPARRDQRSFKVSALVSCEPNILETWDEMLGRAKQVAVKTSPGLDLSSVLNDLHSIESIYVISVENDCKELFLKARKGFEGEATIHCVNLRKGGGVDELSFKLSDEKEADGEFAPPGKYLLEPNASIMKAGGFKSVSKKWGLKALNPRTRLYGADEIVEDFQGRVFEILEDTSIGGKEAKKLFPKKKANVISRNSGMTAEELRKKLGLKEGGELFAIGAAVTGVGRRLYSCRLVKS